MVDDGPHLSEVLNTQCPLPSNPITIRGRRFTREELEFIQHAVNEHYQSGRTKISRVVCDVLGWRQPNRWLKDRACRDVLRQLDVLGLISSPPPRVTKKANGSVGQSDSGQAIENLGPRIETLPDEIELEFAKGNKSEQLWNELVDNFHYLGHKIAVGRCIKYIVMSHSQPIGAISFYTGADDPPPIEDLANTVTATVKDRMAALGWD